MSWGINEHLYLEIIEVAWALLQERQLQDEKTQQVKSGRFLIKRHGNAIGLYEKVWTGRHVALLITYDEGGCEFHRLSDVVVLREVLTTLRQHTVLDDLSAV